MNTINIGPLTQPDIPMLAPLQPEGWDELGPFHQFYLANSYCRPVKALLGDELVGIGTAIRFWSTAWVCHIIVNPELRNRGIGGQIVEHLMDYLVNTCACHTVSLIATDLGYPVYLKHNFVEQSEYYAFTTDKEIAPVDQPEHIVSIAPEHHTAILDMDRHITGEDRAQFITPRLANGYAYIKDKVLGYYLPDLGEGPVYAMDETAGLALLGMKLGTKKKIVIPAENTTAHDFARSHGYTQSEVLKRMIYGRSFGWHPELFYSRIGGWVG